MTDNATPTARLSPLHDVHVAAGASFTDFAGWQMPVRYSSELEEHHAVRRAAGLFDLSHMAEIIVEGPESAAFLDYALSGKISAAAIGQAKYSLLLNEEGGIIDDTYPVPDKPKTWFVIFNDGRPIREGFATRDEAIDCFVESSRAAG